MGVGVVGIIECNFLKPTHNKQDFDYTNEYRCVTYLTFCLFILYFGNAFITFSKDFFGLWMFLHCGTLRKWVGERFA